MAVVMDSGSMGLMVAYVSEFIVDKSLDIAAGPFLASASVVAAAFIVSAADSPAPTTFP